MPFLVVYDDQGSLCLPMGKDADCEGAICTATGTESVVIFDSRETAKRAIKISRLFAELQTAQGKPANSDFLEGYKQVRIIRAESA
jgi:hypothetical protein